jgi:hypothetical protein
MSGKVTAMRKDCQGNAALYGSVEVVIAVSHNMILLYVQCRDILQARVAWLDREPNDDRQLATRVAGCCRTAISDQ